MLLQNKKNITIVIIMTLIYLLESIIPKPFPWFRVGFVNLVIVLLIFYKHPLKNILILIFIRTIITSIILGNIFSPIFIVTLLSAEISALSMFYYYKLLNKKITLYTTSIIGALVNISIQISLFSIILFKSFSLLKMLPYIYIFSYVAGNITGLIANAVCKNNELEKILK